jgi:hypothetical protein
MPTRWRWPRDSPPMIARALENAGALEHLRDALACDSRATSRAVVAWNVEHLLARGARIQRHRLRQVAELPAHGERVAQHVEARDLRGTELVAGR